MKKPMLILSMIVVVSLFVAATSQVYGSTNAANDDTRSVEELAGAKPTKKVNDHAADAPGKDKANGKPVNIKGIIASADASSLVVTQDGGSSVTVMITADTRIKGGVASLLPGLQVGVQATEKDGVLTARSIHVIPGKPVRSHNVGLVTDYQPGVSITIACKDGQSYTFLLTPDAKILPAERLSLLVVGAYVTVISPRDVTTTDLIATGIVVHPAVPPGQHITPQPTPTS
ncbi:MAG: DUF5666 domain-containing protein [Anaerolineaceae bacterium]